VCERVQGACVREGRARVCVRPCPHTNTHTPLTKPELVTFVDVDDNKSSVPTAESEKFPLQTNGPVISTVPLIPVG